MIRNSLRNFKNSPQLVARIGAVALAFAIVFALAIVATPAAQAQTYQVIHSFSGGADGGNPAAGLTVDAAGNFYGTTEFGNQSAGTVFKLMHSGSGWALTTLYSFHGGNDGAYPGGRVAIASDGTLYGTTVYGGGGVCALGCGTVFRLTAPASTLTPWPETQILAFNGNDGANPTDDLTFDQSGNIYGTTMGGGENGGLGLGTVYELTPSWGGGWTETVLYTSGGPGKLPRGGVVFDRFGKLYGVMTGGNDPPTCVAQVFELSPVGLGWAEQTLLCFANDMSGTLYVNGTPEAGLIIDQSGNLYGTTSLAFEITPTSRIWGITNLTYLGGGTPAAKLAMDSAGNLYGTTSNGGAYGYGKVFKLTPSDAVWTYTTLYDFTGGSDGSSPVSNVVFDANGNLYGTALFGGDHGCAGYGCGVIWEITP